MNIKKKMNIKKIYISNKSQGLVNVGVRQCQGQTMSESDKVKIQLKQYAVVEK